MDINGLFRLLPEERLITFSSIEETEEVINQFGIQQSLIQIKPGKFKYHIASNDFNNFSVISERINLPIIGSYVVPKEVITIQLSRPEPCGEFYLFGKDNKNIISVIPHNYQVDMKSKGRTGTDSIVIPVDKFNGLIKKLNIEHIDVTQPFSIKINSPEFNYWQAKICALLRFDPILDSELAENTLMLLIQLIFERYVGEQGNSFFENTKQRAIARLTQEYIYEHYREKITIAQLCEVICVSSRTLQRCFKGYFNISIFEFIELYRLNMAHNLLPYNSVSSTAHMVGYQHLGRFSTKFNKLFKSPARELTKF